MTKISGNSSNANNGIRLTKEHILKFNIKPTGGGDKHSNYPPLLASWVVFFALCAAPLTHSLGQCGAAAACVADINQYTCFSIADVPRLIAAGNPDKIIVATEMRLEEPYTFPDGAEIIMLPNSSIQVYNEVVMNNVTIRNCQDSWAGIHVYLGATLLMHGSSIVGTTTGVELQPNSKAEISGSYFEAVNNAIYAFGTVQLLGNGITGNTFQGGRNGISLSNVPYMAIGSVGSGANTFNNITVNAIRSERSNIDITNCSVNNCAQGVRLVNNDPTIAFDANITAPMSFISVTGGVTALNYNLTLRDAVFDTISGAAAIYVTQDPVTGVGKAPIAVIITGNTISNFKQDGIILTKLRITGSSVSGNTIIDNSSNNSESRNAIKWTNIDRAKIGISSISDNTIISNPQNLTYDLLSQIFITGISLNRGSAKVSLAENTINNSFTRPSDARYSFSGIKLFDSSKHILSGNNINNMASPTSAAPGEGYLGIEARESDGLILQCNTVQGLDNGIFYDGNCDGNNMLENKMPNNAIGLFLESGTIIGQQFLKGNTWEGAAMPGGIEATFRGASTQEVLLSQFKIHTPETPNSDFWAIPRTPGGNAPDDWFTYDPEASCTFNSSCGLNNTGSPCNDGNDADLLTKATRMVVNGQYQNYKGYPASGWEVGIDAFTALESNPGLLTETAAAAFYTANEYGSIGKFARALTAWSNLFLLNEMETVWHTNRANLSQTLMLIRSKHEDLRLSTGAEWPAILQEIAILTDSLTSLQQQHQNLSTQYGALIQSRATALISELDGITTMTIYESNLKTVLTIMAQQALTGNLSWTEAQQQILESIAQQCRWEGGMGVVIARSLTEQYDNYNDAELCPDVPTPRLAPVPVRISNLSPNPSAQLCTISFENPATGIILVRNALGQMIHNRTMEEMNRVDLHTTDWPNGLYWVETITKDGMRNTHKLLVKH